VSPEEINIRLRDLDVPLSDLRVFDLGNNRVRLVGRLTEQQPTEFLSLHTGRGAHSWGVLTSTDALGWISTVVPRFNRPKG
jgi:hypothetical protein